MNFSDGVLKLSLPTEPLMYVRPMYTYSPIPMVTSVYSGENYFNSSLYKDLKNSKEKQDSLMSKAEFKSRGAILDLQA